MPTFCASKSTAQWGTNRITRTPRCARFLHLKALLNLIGVTSQARWRSEPRGKETGLEPATSSLEGSSCIARLAVDGHVMRPLTVR
jgi:hypothetical protein